MNPIKIPIVKNCCIKSNIKSKSLSPPTSGFMQSPYKYILLQGGADQTVSGFVNSKTVSLILLDAIPTIDETVIHKYIDEVNIKGETYIKVNKKDARNICAQLVENGLFATIV